MDCLPYRNLSFIPNEMKVMKKSGMQEDASYDPDKASFLNLMSKNALAAVYVRGSLLAC